jgi:ribosomal protein RSM22 (predicted rRNA methylase)
MSHEIAANPLDPRWVSLVLELAPRVLGPADRKGDALVAQIARLSEIYTRERHAIARAGEALAARLRFFLLRDLPKIQGPLWELGDALPDRLWRICDVGSGLGTSSLGAAELARRRGVERVEVVALERDTASLDVFVQLARAASHLIAPMTIEVRSVELEGLAIGANVPQSDLILVGLTLNELFADRAEADRLDMREALLRDLCDRLAPGGSLVVLEPATRAATRELMMLRNRFAADRSGPKGRDRALRREAPSSATGPRVFAPCVRDAPCPLLLRERDWCHDQLAFELPEELASLAAKAGLRGERLTYAYLTLRRDERRLWDLGGRDRRMARIVGGPVYSKGKTEWDACGELALTRVRQLDRERSADLDGAARGTLLRFDRDPEAALRMRPDVRVERLFR